MPSDGMTAPSLSADDDAGDDLGAGHDGRDSAASDWSDYNLTWLYDPDRLDHLPIDEQVTYYQQRNLGKTHFYKTAVKIFGGPRSRKRVIHAHLTGNRDGQTNDNQLSENTHSHRSDLKPLSEKTPPPELIKARQEKDKLDTYHDWINKRKTFRKSLDSMGINEGWLGRKPNKTPLEQRVLTRMIAERTQRPETPPPPEEPDKEAAIPDELPAVRRPSPLAIKIIEKFLHQKKMRLIDLFQSVDKDKSWTVTRQEFRNAIKQFKVPISDVLLEDLILTLDMDMNDVLDYREFAKGMGLWKIEKRESKRQLVTSNEVNASPTKFSKANGYDPPDIDLDFTTVAENKIEKAAAKQTTTDNSTTPAGRDVHSGHRQGSVDQREGSGHGQRDGSSAEPRVKSAVSCVSRTSSSGSGSQLEPPLPDTRQEQLLLSSSEAMLDMRKHNRQTLNRYNKRGSKLTDSENTIVKTMDAAADRHLIPTTLTGESADLLHKFRQLKFREYNDICELCQERNVPLTEELLQKVLLYPSDKPHNQLKKRIRQPAMPLISRGFHKYSTAQMGTRRSRSPQAGNGRSRSPQSNKPRSHHSTNSRSHQSDIHRRSKSPQASSGMLGSSGSVGQKSQGHGSSANAGRVQAPDAQQTYFSKSALKSSPKKQHLSTGRAVIDKKVDCWMTFEEYDRITRHLSKPNRTLYLSDSDAFWPGQLLDKMRLCMPEPSNKSTAVFQQIDRKPTIKHTCLVTC